MCQISFNPSQTRIEQTILEIILSNQHQIKQNIEHTQFT